MSLNDGSSLLTAPLGQTAASAAYRPLNKPGIMLRKERPGGQIMRPGQQTPTVMAAPPTIGYNTSTATVRTVTDGAMSASSTTLTSSTAAFTQGDVGKRVTVAGAGASGATLSTYIQTVTNATTAVLFTAATTAVSSASTTIGIMKTWALSVPVAPSSQAGPAILTGSLTFGRVPAQNGSSAPLYAAAAAGATTIQIGEKTPGPTGPLATGTYRIDPGPATTATTVADHLSGEEITITSITGSSAPYTATLAAPLAKAHSANSSVNTTAVSDGYNMTNGIGAVGQWNGNTSVSTLEWITDAPLVEVLCKFPSSAPQYRLWVDGQLVTAAPQTAPVGGTNQVPTNAYGYLTLQFTTRTVRRIRFEAATMIPAAIISDASDTVTAPEDPTVRVLWIGDSFLTPQSYGDGIPQLASRLLGWDCVMVDQIGGTGYVATNNGNYTAAPTRLNSQIAAKPDVVVVALSLNDTYTGTLQGTINGYLNSLSSALPNARIYVVGPWSNGDTTNTNKKTVAQAVQGGCSGIPRVAYIDTMLGAAPQPNPWVTGTGTTAAPAGNGNADQIIASDATHPTRTSTGGTGEMFYATRIAAGIAQALPL